MKQGRGYSALLSALVLAVVVWAPAASAAGSLRHDTAPQMRTNAVARSIWSGTELPFTVHAVAAVNPGEMSPGQRLARWFVSHRSNPVGQIEPVGATLGAQSRPAPAPEPGSTPLGARKLVGGDRGVRPRLATAGDWRASGAPRPAIPPDPQVTISQISCPAANRCFAIGSYANMVAASPGLLLRQSGAGWTATAAPLPAGAASNGFIDLNDISCSSSTQCTAVGDYSDTAGTRDQADTQALVETLHANAWTATKARLPVDADYRPVASFASVSCPTAASCTAVGSYSVSGDASPFISTEANGVWASQRAPTPSTGGGGGIFGPGPNTPGLVQVVCEATHDCTTVGYFENNNGAGALFDQESGGAWKSVSVPKGGSSFLDSVACTAPSTCVAVGGLASGDFGQQYGYAVSEKNGALTGVQTPLPSDAPAKKVLQVDLYATACSGVTCVAVGDWATGTITISGNSSDTSVGPGLPLLLTLANGKWVARDLPTDRDVQGVLNAIACPSAGACVAGGQVTQANGDTSLLLTGSGAAWSMSPVAGDPAFNHGQIVAVDCSHGCIGAGTYVDSAGNSQGLLATAAPSGWRGLEAPLPPNAGSPQSIGLQFISCTAPESCVALGTNEGRSIVVETLSGGAWSVARLPDPFDMAWASEIDPTALSCLAGQCVAIADYYTPRGEKAEILVESGGHWTASDAPYPQGTAVVLEGELATLTCPAVRSCVMGGAFLKANGQSAGWIIAGGPGSWRPYGVSAPRNQNVGNETELSGVGCVSATSCTVVGIYGSKKRALPLVVTGSGATWKVAAAPVPAKLGSLTKLNAVLRGVACTTACVATGEAYTNNGGEPGIIDAFSASKASSVVAPGSSGDSDVLLSRPSCSSTTCVIVGATEGNTSTRALVIRGWDTKWKSITPTTGKPPQGSYLGSVTCISAGDCESVGAIEADSNSENGSSQPILAHGLAGNWSLELAPVPADAEKGAGLESAYLESISCPAGGHCVAVGLYLDTSFVDQGLIERQQ